MTLHAISSLVLFIYCYTAHCKWLQAHTRASWWQLAHGLGTACWGTALCVVRPHALWDPQEAIVCVWVCGILARSQIPCPDQQQISSQGRVAFKRRPRQDAQCFKTDDEHSTRSGKFFPCVLTQDRTPLLPVLLGSTACNRQFGDETFLGEWMSWQMLSAGHLLKSQLVRGYRSCSVEHSWFTQNGLQV